MYEMYKQKLRTPQEAVKIVKSGDWVDYATSLGFPVLLDAALAERKEELHNVKIRGNLLFGPIKAVECDPRENISYTTAGISLTTNEDYLTEVYVTIFQ